MSLRKAATTGSAKIIIPAFLALAALLFSSCVGMDTRVSIGKDGSGKVTAEYRLSGELVNFGALEGNRQMLPLPLTRQDVENSLRQAQGLKLDSWSSKKEGADTLIRTVISFKTIEDLMYYLDPRGTRATYESGTDTKSVSFSLGDTLPPLDADMRSLAQEAFKPYSFSFEVDLPSPAKVAAASLPAITVQSKGSMVRFDAGMSDLVATSQAPSLSFSW
jgi:hypothetical protein